MNKLNSEVLVVYHRSDWDGMLCAEIAKYFLCKQNVKIETIGWNYGDEIVVPRQDITVYVMDVDVMEVYGLKEFDQHAHQLLNRTIWIDHHLSAMRRIPFTSMGYQIDGVAACRLAWQWFNREMNLFKLPTRDDFLKPSLNRCYEPSIVKLIGEADVYDTHNIESQYAAFGLRSMDKSKIDWEQLFANNPSTLAPILTIGKVLYDYQHHQDKGIAKFNSFTMDWESIGGFKIHWLCVNSPIFHSATLESVATRNIDALMGFAWVNNHWVVGLRHSPFNKHIDLLQFAQKYGDPKPGGGHPGACGFTCTYLPFPFPPPIKI